MRWKYMDWQFIDDQKEQMIAKRRVAKRVNRSLKKSSKPIPKLGEYCFHGCTQYGLPAVPRDG